MGQMLTAGAKKLSPFVYTEIFDAMPKMTSLCCGVVVEQDEDSQGEYLRIRYENGRQMIVRDAPVELELPLKLCLVALDDSVVLITSDEMQKILKHA